ncbi:hypothetical protein CWI36_0025p0010, partial [Hamiltosporidium magnivora]
MMCEAMLKAINIKRNFTFWALYILSISKVILTQKTIALHFYETEEIQLTKNGTKNCDYFDECFYFDDQKPILYSLDSNSKVLQVFIINLETFFLN